MEVYTEYRILLSNPAFGAHQLTVQGSGQLSLSMVCYLHWKSCRCFPVLRDGAVLVVVVKGH